MESSFTDRDIAELQARMMYLQGQLQALENTVEDFPDPSLRDAGTVGGDSPLWSYKVTHISGLDVSVEAGDRVVIHAASSRASDVATTATLTDSTVNYFFIKYTYGTGWDASFTWSTTLPDQDPTYRLFLIASVVTADGTVTVINHHHLGDLEVYDVVAC